MPTYEYRCTACGHAFDIHQEFTDNALTSCPECSGSLRKVFGSIGVSFKGTGFYRNDARQATKPSSPEKNSSHKESSSSKGATESSSSTKEAKSSTASKKTPATT